MFYLSKDQLELLKSLPITGENLSDTQLKIIKFLDSQKFVDVKREIIRTSLNPETRTYRNTYGKITSVSLSEQGKAFLSEWKHEKFCFWIPIIINSVLSIAAIIISIISLAACVY